MNDLLPMFSLAAIKLAVWGTIVWLLYYLLSLPMRRRERARLVLDVLDQAMKRGESPTSALASLGRMVGTTLGKPFHRLCRLAEQEAPLDAALAENRRLLPPRINALLRTGLKTGELPRLLPTCHRLLPDTTAQALKAQHYLVLLIVGVTPAWVWICVVLGIFVLPELQAMLADYGGVASPRAFGLVQAWGPWLVGFQAVAMLLLWLGTLLYLVGPAVRERWKRYVHLPWDWLALRLPWQRARLQRDFSALLAGFLDAGFPEARAVELAAAGTRNRVFTEAAQRVKTDLAAGAKLPDALKRMDFTGQFQWCLANATHAGGGFEKALAGWHETLDATAFRNEQIASQLLTTALVIVNGVFVALLAAAMFGMFITLMNFAAQG